MVSKDILYSNLWGKNFTCTCVIQKANKSKEAYKRHIDIKKLQLINNTSAAVLNGCTDLFGWSNSSNYMSYTRMEELLFSAAILWPKSRLLKCP